MSLGFKERNFNMNQGSNLTCRARGPGFELMVQIKIFPLKYGHCKYKIWLLIIAVIAIDVMKTQYKATLVGGLKKNIALTLPSWRGGFSHKHFKWEVSICSGTWIWMVNGLCISLEVEIQGLIPVSYLNMFLNINFRFHEKNSNLDQDLKLGLPDL